jgi:chaperone modulatory protein CbpM
MMKMTQTNITWIEGSVVENEVHMTIVELSHASRTPQDLIMSWVSEGVLSPTGSSPQDWRFSGESLRRAKTAAHLTHDLELNTPGVALALDLLDEIAQLRARIQIRS